MTLGQGCIEVLATVDRHARPELIGSEAAHEHEVHEHAPVILERTPRDTSDLGVGAVSTERGGVVVERRATLGGVEPEPRRSTGRRRGTPQARRKYAQQARTGPVATAEQR